MTNTHAGTCSALWARAGAVREALERVGLWEEPHPSVFSEEGVQFAFDAAQRVDDDIWRGILAEYMDDGDEIAELCDCGVIPTTTGGQQ